MKKIFPILLIVCTLGAWGTIFYQNINLPNQYEEYLNCARGAYEKEYYVETLSWVEKAFEVSGIDSFYEADCLKRDSYYGIRDWDSYESQCRFMIQSYPDKVENYEKLIGYYQSIEKTESLCKLLPGYLERWPDNEVILNAQKEVNRSYEYIRAGYYDVEYASSSLVNIQIMETETIDEKNVVVKRLYNSKGNEIFNGGYSEIAVSQDLTSCFVREQNGTWKKVNTQDYLLAKNENTGFEEIHSLSNDGIAVAVIEGKYQFINGEMKINERKWEKAGTFYHGINAVKENGKWALVTLENWDTVAEFPYDNIPLNSQDCCAVDGVCVVADSKGYYILNTENLEPVSIEYYEELKAFECMQPTSYRKGDKWGFVNSQGEIYIEAEYEDAMPFVNGYAAIKRNGLWGYIDKENNMVVEPMFQKALNVLPSGFAYVQNELGYWDYIIIEKLYYEN